MKNKKRSFDMMNYIKKMEELDIGFFHMKQDQSVDHIDEILDALERNEERIDQVNTKMYEICNVQMKYIEMNKHVQSEIDSYKNYIDTRNKENIADRLEKMTKERWMADEKESLTKGIEEMSEEYKELKKTLFDNFSFWGES